MTATFAINGNDKSRAKASTAGAAAGHAEKAAANAASAAVAAAADVPSDSRAEKAVAIARHAAEAAPEPADPPTKPLVQPVLPPSPLRTLCTPPPALARFHSATVSGATRCATLGRPSSYAIAGRRHRSAYTGAGPVHPIPTVIAAPRQQFNANRRLAGGNAAASTRHLRPVQKPPLNRDPQEFVHRDAVAADQQGHRVGIVPLEA